MEEPAISPDNVLEIETPNEDHIPTNEEITTETIEETREEILTKGILLAMIEIIGIEIIRIGIGREVGMIVMRGMVIGIVIDTKNVDVGLLRTLPNHHRKAVAVEDMTERKRRKGEEGQEADLLFEIKTDLRQLIGLFDFNFLDMIRMCFGGLFSGDVLVCFWSVGL